MKNVLDYLILTKWKYKVPLKDVYGPRQTHYKHKFHMEKVYLRVLIDATKNHLWIKILFKSEHALERTFN